MTQIFVDGGTGSIKLEQKELVSLLFLMQKPRPTVIPLF